MAKIKIKVTEDCIGCGQCVNVCDNFELGSDGFAHPIKETVDDIGCNQSAADICPVSAIKIEGSDDKSSKD